jgi:hypothetical protein
MLCLKMPSPLTSMPKLVWAVAGSPAEHRRQPTLHVAANRNTGAARYTALVPSCQHGARASPSRAGAPVFDRGGVIVDGPIGTTYPVVEDGVQAERAES